MPKLVSTRRSRVLNRLFQQVFPAQTLVLGMLRQEFYHCAVSQRYGAQAIVRFLVLLYATQYSHNQGTLTEAESPVPMTSSYLLVQISCFSMKILIFIFTKQAILMKKIKRTRPSRSVSILRSSYLVDTFCSQVMLVYYFSQTISMSISRDHLYDYKVTLGAALIDST